MATVSSVCLPDMITVVDTVVDILMDAGLDFVTGGELDPVRTVVDGPTVVEGA